MSERILIADDEDVLRSNLCTFLRESGYDVDAVPDGEQALARVLSEDYAAVIADIHMPKLDGISLLRRIVDERPDTFVLLITAYAAVDSAIEALRLGAFDYLLKPIIFEDLQQKIAKLASYRSLKQEVSRLRRDMQKRLGYAGIVGQSPAILRVFDLITRVAPTDSTVLVTGETGVGKELVARAIHAGSLRQDREIIAINAAAISPDVLESQLFGHERGAFTGAVRPAEGILRGVRGGTVFLDEIGELSLSGQAKLLRAIETHEILPVGGQRPLRVSFRLIAATNQRLEERVASGQFRQDLYFRLNVFRIEVPPLRERREDIAALVQHFVQHHAAALGRPTVGVTNEGMRLLLAYGWPGNVRELANTIERAVLLAAESDIGPETLPSDLRTGPTLPMALREAVEEAERRHIAWVLRQAGGNREQAARILEVDRATLYRRLEKYGLS